MGQQSLQRQMRTTGDGADHSMERATVVPGHPAAPIPGVYLDPNADGVRKLRGKMLYGGHRLHQQLEPDTPGECVNRRELRARSQGTRW